MAPPELLLRQPPWLVVLEALLLVALIGWGDYVTGWEWSFFVFYALPIAFVVRRTDRRVGFGFAILCAVVWWIAQLDNNPYRTASGFALAGVTRLFYFFVLVFAVAAVKAQRELDRFRIETLESARQLEREVLRTSEREQRRIGRDLHDSLGPNLAAMAYAANFLAKELRTRGQPEAESAEQLQKIAAESMSLVRDLARGLFPVQMDEMGLSATLDDLARTTSRMTSVMVSFTEIGDTLVGDHEISMHFYRIAQEALNNAIKHGGAKSVGIALRASDGVLELEIADNGIGMNLSEVGHAGVGLHSMKYRAEAIGGTIEFQSSDGGGVVVSCRLPLDPSARIRVAP